MPNDLLKAQLEESVDKLTDVLVNFDILPEDNTLNILLMAVSIAAGELKKEIAKHSS